MVEGGGDLPSTMLVNTSRLLEGACSKSLFIQVPIICNLSIQRLTLPHREMLLASSRWAEMEVTIGWRPSAFVIVAMVTTG